MTEAPLQINVLDLAQLREDGTPHTLLDVREAPEVQTCAIAGSLWIPMQEIPARLDELPRDQPIVVLCHLGGRSMRVTGFLRQNGFANASNLAGGIDAWAQMVEPGMPRY